MRPKSESSKPAAAAAAAAEPVAVFAHTSLDAHRIALESTSSRSMKYAALSIEAATAVIAFLGPRRLLRRGHCART
ncbi:MAG: hypothetical protein U0263_25880 [Polyangiaceae bacterium]